MEARNGKIEEEETFHIWSINLESSIKQFVKGKEDKDFHICEDKSLWSEKTKASCNLTCIILFTLAVRFCKLGIYNQVVAVH